MDSFTKELLEDDSIEKRIDADGNIYRMRVLGRGENLFFQENKNYLFCQINAGEGVVFTKSIKKWDNKKTSFKEEEFQRVKDLIVKYYKEIYNPDYHED